MNPHTDAERPLTTILSGNRYIWCKNYRMGSAFLKTLIVDDEEIARRVLREELECMPDIDIVGEADNGKDGLRKIEELPSRSGLPRPSDACYGRL